MLVDARRSDCAQTLCLQLPALEETLSPRPSSMAYALELLKSKPIACLPEPRQGHSHTPEVPDS